MGEIHGRERRLPHIGVGVPGQGPKPSVDRIDGLDHAGEVTALDNFLNEPELLIRLLRIRIPNGNCRRHIGLTDIVGAQFLERRIGVHGLVQGVSVDQRRRLIGHDLFKDRSDGFALGEPVTTDLRQELGRVLLVEHDRPR